MKHQSVLKCKDKNVNEMVYLNKVMLVLLVHKLNESREAGIHCISVCVNSCIDEVLRLDTISPSY